MSVTISGDGTITGARGFRYAGTRYYTSSGTFAKADPLGTGDIGLRAIRVRVQGAGAGGGARNTANGNTGGGGGGGGYAERFFANISTLDASVTVTRGAGGSGATGVSGSDEVGSDGGVSEFGTSGDAWHTESDGGKAGTSAVKGGSGGAGLEGDFLVAGSGGGSGSSAATRGIPAGAGGSSHLGGGGLAQGSYTDSTGDSGGLYGGGGAGNSRFGLTRSGGSGADGIVIVDCYV